MSGLVSTTLAFLRAQARSSVVGVTVEGDRAQAGNEPRAQRAELVLGERLGREDEQRGVAAVGHDRFDDRNLVAERLPRRGAGRDDDARSCAQLVDRLGLMRVEPLDAARAIRSATSLGQRCGHVRVLRPGAPAAPRGARAGRRAPGRPRARRAHRTRPSAEGTDRLRHPASLLFWPLGDRSGRICLAPTARRARLRCSRLAGARARSSPGGCSGRSMERVEGRHEPHARDCGPAAASARPACGSSSKSAMRRTSSTPARSTSSCRPDGRYEGRQGCDPARDRQRRVRTPRLARVARRERDGQHDPARAGGPARRSSSVRSSIVLSRA